MALISMSLSAFGSIMKSLALLPLLALLLVSIRQLSDLANCYTDKYMVTVGFGLHILQRHL
jgi:hypothetical protein